MTDLSGICAVVTGAGKGIGRATALALAAEGANVFGVARTEDDLLALEKEAKPLKGKFTPFAADVADEEKIHLLFEGIRKWVERMDVLVNAAGTGTFGPSDEFPVSEWRRIVETNLTGAFVCSREAIRLMKLQGRGIVVNVSSIAGKRGLPQAAAYCASKWGLAGMGQSLSEELRGTGIKVTTLFPGATDTDFWKRMPISPDPSRMMKPEQIAEIIVELAKRPASVCVDEMVIFPPEGML